MSNKNGCKIQLIKLLQTINITVSTLYGGKLQKLNTFFS